MEPKLFILESSLNRHFIFYQCKSGFMHQFNWYLEWDLAFFCFLISQTSLHSFLKYFCEHVLSSCFKLCIHIFSLKLLTAVHFLSKLTFGYCSSFKFKIYKEASHVMGKLAIKMYKGVCPFLGYMFSHLIKTQFPFITWNLQFLATI